MCVSLDGLAVDVGDSIVTIYAKSKDGGSSQGTGFVLGPGLVATAYHVVQSASEIEIFDYRIRKHVAPTLEWLDAKHDIAVLGIATAKDLPIIPLGTALPSPEHEIRVVGSPRGLPNQIIFGRVTSQGYGDSKSISSAGGKKVFAESIDVFPVDLTVYSGMSGAPAMTQSGAAIGILSGSYDEGRGIAWLIPGKYVRALMAQPRLSKRAKDMAAWPSLSLMDRGWVSLKRSYSKPLTSEHIARLEILEGAFRDLRGTWRTDARHQTLVFQDPFLGRCERIVQRAVRLELAALDSDAISIRGQHSINTTSRALYKVGSQGAFPELCNEQVFKDSQRSRGELRVTGRVTLEGDDVRLNTNKNPTLPATINVTDCDGDLCQPAMYGAHRLDSVELLSPSKVRWAENILEKAP